MITLPTVTQWNNSTKLMLTGCNLWKAFKIGLPLKWQNLDHQSMSSCQAGLKRKGGGNPMRSQKEKYFVREVQLSGAQNANKLDTTGALVKGGIVLGQVWQHLNLMAKY